jgi:hypothetical protein
MTSFISQWEYTQFGMDMVDGECGDDPLEKLHHRIKLDLNEKRGKKILGKIFSTRKFPTNLKHLRATDGACNEGFPPLIEGNGKASVKSVQACSSTGLVAYGIDVGLVHVFSIE